MALVVWDGPEEREATSVWVFREIQLGLCLELREYLGSEQGQCWKVRLDHFLVAFLPDQGVSTFSSRQWGDTEASRQVKDARIVCLWSAR